MAEAIEDKSASAIIEFLVLRDGQIVRLEDGGDIGRGPLFRRMNEGVAAGDDEASDPEGRSGLRTFGIANLHALAQDIGRRLIA
jgi:hypothetical protein